MGKATAPASAPLLTILFTSFSLRVDLVLPRTHKIFRQLSHSTVVIAAQFCHHLANLGCAYDLLDRVDTALQVLEDLARVLQREELRGTS